MRDNKSKQHHSKQMKRQCNFSIFEEILMQMFQEGDLTREDSSNHCHRGNANSATLGGESSIEF